jgi:hypothetical protein
MEARIASADSTGGKLYGLRWQSPAATPLSSGKRALNIPAVAHV